MTTTWHPSLLFRLLHHKQSWTIQKALPGKFLIDCQDGAFQLYQSYNGWRLLDKQTGKTYLLTRNGIQLYENRFGLGEVVIDTYGKELRLRGVGLSSIGGLMEELLRGESYVREGVARFMAAWKTVQAWENYTRQAARAELAQRGWVTSRFQARALAQRPRDIEHMLEQYFIKEMIEEREAEFLQTLQFWEDDHSNYFQFLNQMHIDKAVKESSDFFNRVEKSPLTLEQRIPVTCTDNRVLVVASAGSGKTSCLVAKVGYSLLQGHSLPSSTLMLAFNREAADELRSRIIDRLKPLGLPATQIQVKTFHSLSLEIIESATGKKPVIAPWTQSDQGKLAQLLRFIKELSAIDEAYRHDLVLMSYVLGLDLPSFDKELDAPDSWDKSLTTGFHSLLDESLESPMHTIVANWLTVHGVPYVYRPTPEQCNLPKACNHSSTFYLPQSATHLEVWDLDGKGEPHPSEKKYRHFMQHAREVHRDVKTDMIEVYNSTLRDSGDFGVLLKALRARGYKMEVREPTEFTGRKPLELDHLATVMKSFITHIKANRWTHDDLLDNLNNPAYRTDFFYRTSVFLRLIMPVYNRWEHLLSSEGHIDFDDMVNRAADLVSAGKWRSPFQLIAVDEFQDSSRSRAHLLKVLSAEEDTCLFCVGDDWQSINGFSGADVSVMSRFDKIFGDSTHFKLETTFRCPQSLCDISTSFISKNPSQISKTVYSAKADVFEPVRLIEAPMTMQPDLALLSALHSELVRLNQLAEKDKKHFSVMVLGRYNYDKYFADKDALPRLPRLSVRFLSVHQSKGLEADYVVVPRMSSAAYAFPCQTKDDSALNLALAAPDSYPFSEERRLFYVAITRAKLGVTLIANKGLESNFFTELSHDHAISVKKAELTATSAVTCPACEKGFLLEKKGKGANGAYSFYGCNRFPVCKKTFTNDQVANLRKTKN